MKIHVLHTGEVRVSPYLPFGENFKVASSGEHSNLNAIGFAIGFVLMRPPIPNDSSISAAASSSGTRWVTDRDVWCSSG